MRQTEEQYFLSDLTVGGNFIPQTARLSGDSILSQEHSSRAVIFRAFTGMLFVILGGVARFGMHHKYVYDTFKTQIRIAL